MPKVGSKTILKTAIFSGDTINKITILTKTGQAWFVAILLLTLPAISLAKGTTSAIRGTVTTPNGNAASGASIRAVDTRTGRASTATANDSGRFLVDNLAVGGPYTVTITSSRFGTQTVTGINLGLDATFEFAVAFESQTMEEVIVTATAIDSAEVAIGPSSSFTYDDLQNTPAFNRDLRDIIKLDPRIYIDEGFVDAIQCIGANPRFNSLTIDGVRQNDNFGLNSNGYPTQRQPFPYDSIQNVSVELSPFDVQYGGFSACNINAVTRSGSNKYEGRVWFDYTDSDFKGDKLEGDSVPIGTFDETRIGFSFGGAIIPDTLFFFGAYEKADGADVFSRCAGDEACGSPVEGVTRAQLDRIAAIARDLYNYEPGEGILNAPNEDEKFLIRMNWYINDAHDAAFTYNFNDGFNITESDGDADEFEFSNHFYSRGAELNSWSFQLLSDWSDNFSTEARIGFSELDATVQTQNLQGFGEVQVETYADVDGDGNFTKAIVYLGGDDSRQSNKLKYDTLSIKLGGTYLLGDHVITAGYEREVTDVFNLFVQHSIGQYNFDESNTDLDGNPVGCSRSRPDGCIDQFEAFSPDDIYFDNSASLNPNDAAARFESTVNTIYLQDEYSFPDHNVTLTAGLRYDWYTSDDLPKANQNFTDRYGFSNRQNFDGESLLQPRLGITWEISDALTVRGGIGLYGGGNPNVWLGNNYQNDGITVIKSREGDGGNKDLNVNPTKDLTTIALGQDGSGRPIYDAPQAQIAAVAAGSSDEGINAIDPNFKIPSNWKYSLGASYYFDNGMVFSGDVILTDSEDSALIVDGSYVEISKAPDGRPVYYQADLNVPGCATDPVGTGPACDRLFSGDYILTNVEGSDARQLSYSWTLAKEYDFGLDWTLGYAYTESEEVSPMTSSVAFSNFFNTSVSDPNNPGLDTSNYEIAHRIILRMNYEKEFFPGLATRISLFGSRNSGRPFSYTFSEQEMFVRGPFFFPSDDRSLLYMPSGPDDPRVRFAPGFDQDAFFAYAAEHGLDEFGGHILPRNAFQGSWRTKFDVRVSQELPGFHKDHNATAYLVIENVGNLLNDDWGVLYERSFPRAAPLVQASYLSYRTPGDYSDDPYLFEEFIPQSQSRVADASLWSIRLGFNYNF